MAANGAPTTGTILTHPGVVNVVIDQDNVNRLMDGAQQIETAAANVDDANAMDAILTLLGMIVMVVRILVNLIVDFSGHISNFETMVESKIMTLQGQARASCSQSRL